MRQILFLGFILAVVLTSCSKDKQKAVENTSEVLEEQQVTTVSRIGITLNPTAKKAVQQWHKYQLVKEKIERYQSITKNQALQNAEELALLIEDVSDTIDVKILDRPDVKIRFNVLHNYAYRLYDMSTIPSISDEEVSEEITGLLDAFSALNDKINVVYTIAEYKKTYKSFDTAVFENSLPTEKMIQDKPTPFKIESPSKKKVKKTQKRKAAPNSKFIKRKTVEKQ